MKYDPLASGLYQYARLEARIAELGGRVPPPWPWAMYGRRVDLALRNLQLLELVEDLEKERTRHEKQ